MAEKKHSAFALLNILKENTDKDHPLTTKEILSLLEMQYGLTLERRTVYANIDLLRQALEDVTRGKEMAARMEPLDIIEVDARAAFDTLGEIIGETVSDEVLDEVFSRFCLGK